jgi:hypothetical protein
MSFCAVVIIIKGSPQNGHSALGSAGGGGVNADSQEGSGAAPQAWVA